MFNVLLYENQGSEIVVDVPAIMIVSSTRIGQGKNNYWWEEELKEDNVIIITNKPLGQTSSLWLGISGLCFYLHDARDL